MIFYVLVAYGIALWGAYICWAAEQEEAEEKKAIKRVLKNLAKTEGGADYKLMIEDEEGGEKKKKKKKKAVKAIEHRRRDDDSDE
jgi:hypothetical protein